MKQYIKTSWYYCYFEEDVTTKKSDSKKWNDGVWETNRWCIKADSLKKGLEGLSKYCNENNYEIKGIIPIDRAQSYEYGQAVKDYNSRYNTATTAGWGYGWGWGLGQGWGITMTDGFGAMLQSIEMLTEEEYDARVAEDERLKKLAEEQAALEKERSEKKDQLEKEISKYSSLIQETKAKITRNQEQVAEKQTVIAGGVTEQEKGLLKKKIIYIVDSQKYPNRDDANVYLGQLEIDVKNLKAENDTFESMMIQYQESLDECAQKLEAL